MAKSGLIVTSFLLLSIVAIGYCISPTGCRDAEGVKHTPIGQTASDNTWESIESVVAYVEYEKRAPACFSTCERFCKRKSASCIAFSSWIKKDSSDATCYCYGWDRLPNFKDWGDDRYQSGWCVTGWFETDTM